MTTLATGNRRLLKLADYLETIPRGSYDQTRLSSGSPKCAMAYAMDMPEYNRWLRATANPKNQLGVNSSQAFALNEAGDDWQRIFGIEGCKQPNGKPATTGKQAAKFIRKFVEERRS